MKTLDQEIRIEQKHIDKGEACNAWRCPAALALFEQVSGLEHVCVGEDTICLTIYQGEGKRYKIKTPPELAEAIDKFDSTGKMLPMRFQLIIP